MNLEALGVLALMTATNLVQVDITPIYEPLNAVVKMQSYPAPVFGYRIYWSSVSGSYINKVEGPAPGGVSESTFPTITVSNLVTGHRYYFAATTLIKSTGGVSESAMSDEVEFFRMVRIFGVLCPSNYLIQSSSDLKNWTSSANAIFTNSGRAMFFRAKTNTQLIIPTH
jgi:hypothetical protein